MITIEATPELFAPVINGVEVPVRVWRGTTAGGVQVELMVLSIVPTKDEDLDRLRAELPPFMVPSRDVYHIKTEDS